MKTKTLNEIIKLCEALSNRHRLRIIAALSEKKEKKKYTFELTRELEISRPLLYLHLRKLEEVGILKGEDRAWKR
jgi:ArsR family transcriptional regulator